MQNGELDLLMTKLHRQLSACLQQPTCHSLAPTRTAADDHAPHVGACLAAHATSEKRIGTVQAGIDL